MTTTATTPPKPIWVAVDAMGGDYAPQSIVEGALLGAKLHQVGIQLVGVPAKIEAELAKHNTDGLQIEIVPAHDLIDMGESATAVRRKKDASIVVTAKQVSDGKAQAMVAAGSTGAAMAAALLYIGRMEGIDRPGIGIVMPSMGKPCLMLDAGANADCLPEMMVQFARIGSVFMQTLHGVNPAKVGLLNIGTEEGKGNAFVNAAYPLLESDPSIHFAGNVEGRDIFLGDVDVIVTDGFTGNVALKSAEGVSTMLLRYLKQELQANLKNKVGALLAKSAFIRARKKVDHEEFGGALLLGINGICVIAHGGSSPYAIQNAIRVAKEGIQADVLRKMAEKLNTQLATV